MSTGAEARTALAKGLLFLEQAQLPSGEFPVFASTDPTLAERVAPDPSIFPTALAVHCLSFWPAAGHLHRRGLDFLLAQMDGHGLWRHWTRDHPHHGQLPPDLDDTSCASLALHRAGISFPDNRPLLLGNRDGKGLFFTWLAPRFAWSGRRHMAVTLRLLAHAPTLYLFFRRTSAAPRDVDTVVNANALFYLGEFPGQDRVVAFLARVLAEGREAQCDKWYENPFVLWYFLSRALAGRCERSTALILDRLGAQAPSNPLEAALAQSTFFNCGARPAASAVTGLVAAQAESGAWARSALYHGGRARLSDTTFASRHPDTPHWGSESLTTAFCVEALARHLSDPP